MFCAGNGHISENEAARGSFSHTILENEGGDEKSAFSTDRSSTVLVCVSDSRVRYLAS